MVSKTLRSLGYLIIFNAYAVTPKITSVLPTTLSCGVDNCLNKTITITGTGFNSDATVPALEDLSACSVVSSKKITCSLFAQQSAGSFILKVKNETENLESIVTKANFSLSFAAPKVSSVSPSTVTCGINDCLDQEITIKGSNFRSDATVPALTSDLATCEEPKDAGTVIKCKLKAQTKSTRYTLAVRNAALGQTSPASTPNFSVFLTPLAVTSISPTTVTCGINDCAGQVITIKGTGFKSDATVPALANVPAQESDLATCLNPNDAGTQITCTLKAQSASGSHKLAVKNVAKNQTSTNAPVLAIKTTTLSLTSVSPATLTCGGDSCAGQVITLKGTGFKSDATVPALTAEGVDLATCLAPNAPGTEIACTLKAQSLAKTHTLFVTNVAKNQTSLNSVKLAIEFSVPKITSVEPSSISCGMNDCLGEKITINGTGFRSDATVPALTGLATCEAPKEGGTKIDCTLNAQPASASYKLAVKNNSLNQTASVSANNFTVNLAVLSITSVSPSTLSCGWNQCEGEKVTITGTGFRSDAKVSALTGVATCEAPTDGGTKIDCTLKKHSASTSYKLNVLNVAKNKSTAITSVNLQVNLKALPSVTSIDFDSRPNCAGFKVTITGTNFGPNASSVDFPGYCEAPTENGTKILCVTSKQTNLAQAYNVRISNPNIADSTKPFLSTSFKRLTLSSVSLLCPSLAYATPNAEYPVYEEITENEPIITGFTPTSYSISPELPDGLELDTKTGVISGTPTTLFEGSTFNVTASSASISLSESITLTSKIVEKTMGGSTEIVFHKADGTVMSWGNFYGGLALSENLTDVKKVFLYNDNFALKNDGSVVRWGGTVDSFNSYDEYIPYPEAQVTNIKNIYSNNLANAALKNDGSVVTWGFPDFGGDSSSVQAQLTNVKKIYTSISAFAALKQDGTVVTWGNSEYGGDSSSVQAQLTNVKKIYSNDMSFVALKNDGSVVTWGFPSQGGDSSSVQAQLTNVKKIYSIANAVAALKSDGTVVTWGSPDWGGDSSSVQAQLTNVKKIYWSHTSFAALKTDGTVVSWGPADRGGDSSSVQAQLTNVKEIYSNGNSFVALTSDGRVVTWGNSEYGGDSSSVQAQLTNVKKIYSNNYAYVALKNDGSFVTWGKSSQGGNSSSVQAQLTNVKEIYPSYAAFAALKNDGTVVTWGDPNWGGDSSSVKLNLKNIEKLYGNFDSFVAIKNDGRIINWPGSIKFPQNNMKKIFANKNAFVSSYWDAEQETDKITFWGKSTYNNNTTDIPCHSCERSMVSNEYAFAAFSYDTVTYKTKLEAWGNPLYGGTLPETLKEARFDYIYDIISTERAFAVTVNGQVYTWGHSGWGGDSSGVQDQLTNVKKIFSTLYSFAALKTDGTVVTWGTANRGGDSSSVQAQLTNVKKIYSNQNAFAALKNDGSVVTWGTSSSGGDSSSVQAQLTNVKEIYSTGFSFAALKNDGTVVTWGTSSLGGDSSSVQAQLTNIYKIYSGLFYFAALKNDGSVVTWGDPDFLPSSSVKEQLTNVIEIIPGDDGGAVLKEDGTVVSWALNHFPGDSAQLTNVIKVVAYNGRAQSLNSIAFAALKNDGTVSTWGEPMWNGGDSSRVQAQLNDIVDIFATSGAFAAVKKDGTIITWGLNNYGGRYPNFYQ